MVSHQSVPQHGSRGINKTRIFTSTKGREIQALNTFLLLLYKRLKSIALMSLTDLFWAIFRVSIEFFICLECLSTSIQNCSEISLNIRAFDYCLLRHRTSNTFEQVWKSNSIFAWENLKSKLICQSTLFCNCQFKQIRKSHTRNEIQISMNDLFLLSRGSFKVLLRMTQVVLRTGYRENDNKLQV